MHAQLTSQSESWRTQSLSWDIILALGPRCPWGRAFPVEHRATLLRGRMELPTSRTPPVPISGLTRFLGLVRFSSGRRVFDERRPLLAGSLSEAKVEGRQPGLANDGPGGAYGKLLPGMRHDRDAPGGVLVLAVAALLGGKDEAMLLQNPDDLDRADGV